MSSRKFDPKKLAKLNDPERFKTLNPDILWKAAGVRDPEALIDIGAGTGFFAVPFCEKMGEGKVYACDLSETMIEWMKENLPTRYRDRIVPLRMEESAVPLPDETGDMIYMINLHHELEKPVEMMREGYRLLKPGGILLIVDWKKRETSDGPPLSIRVPAEEMIGHMRAGGFVEIVRHDLLPEHELLVGKKKDLGEGSGSCGQTVSFPEERATC